MDRFKDFTTGAKSKAADHKDQIHQAIEKVETAADQRTGGQYHDQIAKAGTRANALTDRLAPHGEGEPEAPGVPVQPGPAPGPGAPPKSDAGTTSPPSGPGQPPAANA